LAADAATGGTSRPPRRNAVSGKSVDSQPQVPRLGEDAENGGAENAPAGPSNRPAY